MLSAFPRLLTLVPPFGEFSLRGTLYDTFAAEKIEEGRSIFGTYPATDFI